MVGMLQGVGIVCGGRKLEARCSKLPHGLLRWRLRTTVGVDFLDGRDLVLLWRLQRFCIKLLVFIV